MAAAMTLPAVFGILPRRIQMLAHLDLPRAHQPCGGTIMNLRMRPLLTLCGFKAVYLVLSGIDLHIEKKLIFPSSVSGNP